jgi:predicted RND superfamily exporter protein
MKINVDDILNFEFSFQFAKSKQTFFVAPIVCLLIAFIVGTIFFSWVDLKPNLGSNFFFSSDDPQMQDEQKIQTLFKQDPQIILSVKGNIRSALYYERIKKITDEVLSLEDVIGAQSLSHGPKDFEDALSGPLWSRIIISHDEQSTLIPIFVQEKAAENFILQIEELVIRNKKPDFEILVSGGPYIVELLRRSLFKDIKIFSLVAFVFFGALFILFFRSWRVLFSTLVTCGIASMLTLIAVQEIGVEMGMLTANLSTIIFVLTLSHIIFIVFNWHEIENQKTSKTTSNISEALLRTLPGSFWSMLTTFLGFLSLLFVKATPLRQLGYAGSMGTIISFFCAYFFFALMFPLAEKGLRLKQVSQERGVFDLFFIKKHPILFSALVVISLLCALGIPRINTDPSLLDYLKKVRSLKQD